MNIIQPALTLVNNYGGRVLFYAKKYAPEILTGVGIVSGVASTVLAVRATTKVDPIIYMHEEDIENIKATRAGYSEEEYPQKVYISDLIKEYTFTTMRLAKLYAPAIGMGAASIACVLAAHGIMARRNVAALAALEALDASYKAYRARVEEVHGADGEKAIAYGMEDGKVHTKTDPETGEKWKQIETTLNSRLYSPYARVFDEQSTLYDRRHDVNMMALTAAQESANITLRAKGFVFLNDVYESLGFPKTPAGQIVGWMLNDEEDIGDNYVDFGIYDTANERNRLFINGHEPYIILDFNVDGVIWDKI